MRRSLLLPFQLSRRHLLALVPVSTALAAALGASNTRIFPAGMRARAQEPELELETVSVALDWYPNANHAGLYLAQERGYYAEAGLAPEFYTPSDPTTVLQTVGAGRDDFGISYQTDILLARAAGVPVVSVLALVQTPLQGVMVLADSGITRPADLAGKTVGYPGIPSQEAFLATMLEDDGAHGRRRPGQHRLQPGAGAHLGTGRRLTRRVLDPRADPGRTGGVSNQRPEGR
ncbi:MAG: putative pyrimidine precursor biosynthesis enzyme [Thermomicrobiales bacterium]|nr:putative pyrimidine precursor biosynthesis enzyme [Thermomicrobiales bacterium]